MPVARRCRGFSSFFTRWLPPARIAGANPTLYGKSVGLLDDVRVLAGLRPASGLARDVDGTLAVSARPPSLGPETRALPAIANTGVLLASPTGALGSPSPAGAARFAGGRLSWDSQLQMLGNASIILPPETADESWRMINLDKKSIIGMSATRLLQVLADMSPEVSRALWDFLRLCNPGHEFKAFYPNTDRPHVQGQKAIDAFYRTLADRYGSVDVVHGRLFFSAFIRGAMMAELVLDERGREPLDFATPDPWTARFQRRNDPVLGQVWDLGQFQAAQFVLLDRPTIRYIPIDPAPGNPYGRPPAAPGIFSAIFLLGLLADLRRVIAQQGYPRLDISIDLKILYDTTPPAVRNDPVQWGSIVLREYNKIVEAYQGLEPDSAFIHTTSSTVNGAKAAVSADAVGPIDGVIGALTEQLARGLKSMPIMFGITEGMSEANANRQWEIHAAGVKAIQHIGESIWGNLGTMMLEAQGIPAEAKMEYAELRAAEMFRDAQTEAQIIQNESDKYWMGWTSQDEASENATGHPAEEPEPREQPTTETVYMAPGSAAPAEPPPPGKPSKGPKAGGGAPDASDVADSKDDTAEKGAASRGVVVRRLRWPTLRRVRRATTIKAKGEPLAGVPAAVGFDVGDEHRISTEFDDAVPDMAGLLEARVDARSTGVRRNGHTARV
jgi:hypothetical protein